MSLSAVQTSNYNAYATNPSPYGTYNNNPYGNANPYGNGGVSSDTNITYKKDFSSITSLVSGAAGGGFAAYKLGGKMGESIKGLFGKAPVTPPADGAAKAGFGKNFAGGIKGVAMTGLKGAGLSALFAAGVSAVGNGVGVATGQVNGSDAVGNVVKDTIGGAVGGLTGVTLGGFASMIPVGGVFGTVLTVGFGAIGGVLGSQLAQSMTEGF